MYSNPYPHVAPESRHSPSPRRSLDSDHTLTTLGARQPDPAYDPYSDGAESFVKPSHYRDASWAPGTPTLNRATSLNFRHNRTRQARSRRWLIVAAAVAIVVLAGGVATVAVILVRSNSSDSASSGGASALNGVSLSSSPTPTPLSSSSSSAASSPTSSTTTTTTVAATSTTPLPSGSLASYAPNAVTPGPSPAKYPLTTLGGTCGKDKSCPSGTCCSSYTKSCGTGVNFCSPSVCMSAFGDCGGDVSGGYTRSPNRLPWNASVVADMGSTFPQPCVEPGMVAFTFDDGPYIYTDNVLNQLANLSIKATFFLNGLNYGDIFQYNATVQRMLADGHQIGSHTWSHPDIKNTSVVPNFQYLNNYELIPMEAALKALIGKVPIYFRAPFGNWPADYTALMGQIGYRYVADWNVDTGDSDGVCSEASCMTDATKAWLKTVTPQTGSSIQEEHEVNPWTDAAWANTYPLYVAAGFTKFVTLHECLTGSADLSGAYTD